MVIKGDGILVTGVTGTLGGKVKVSFNNSSFLGYKDLVCLSLKKIPQTGLINQTMDLISVKPVK
ncbi:hypothetical protein [Rossellomorea sp. YZS02]|uniref:hypothetical protein n=1 Tax=Rossellomorea sp. YZS02 TaxID=3097358 RepID=UPI002A12E509|nr:hypothetical protein [Rossellomorea sp. YZS02]MDX8342402.1 hypothetical protein [Rossellomorea sp. YZS02]